MRHRLDPGADGSYLIGKSVHSVKEAKNAVPQSVRSPCNQALAPRNG